MMEKLINPFYYIAGLKSLVLGLVVLIVLTLSSYATGTHFYGLTHISFAKDTQLIQFAFEHTIHWLLLSIAFYISGLILSKSHIRPIDFLGTTLLSRVPMLIVPLIRFIPIFESFVYNSAEMYVLIGIHILCAIWTVALLFNGYKVSANLKDKTLIYSFIISVLLVEVITRIILQSITLKF